MAAWKKICCPVDFSWESRSAMEEAAELAWRFGGDLTLVHVDDRPLPAVEALGVEKRDQGKIELERKLAAWRDEAEPIATTAVDHILLAGGPAEEIARFARDGHYDVIVMGTRGQGGREWWSGLGSVAQAVVREASCTVVVVRGRISRAPEHRSSA
jgi:nucleotide-binding universal stress UspA family protein